MQDKKTYFLCIDVLIYILASLYSNTYLPLSFIALIRCLVTRAWLPRDTLRYLAIPCDNLLDFGISPNQPSHQPANQSVPSLLLSTWSTYIPYLKVCPDICEPTGFLALIFASHHVTQSPASLIKPKLAHPHSIIPALFPPDTPCQPQQVIHDS